MTESEFIEKNVADWEALEQLLASTNRDADTLQKLFIKVSGDLSYASTFYPNRSVRLYLNKLTQQIFDTIEKESKSQLSFEKVKIFFTRILPLEVYRSRKAFALSFVIFLLAVVVGAVSTAHSEDFTRVILGDDYVNMTDRNIAEGDPMGVYKDEAKMDMFLRITINNIRVSFLAFILGIFGGLGTIILLLYNGIMVGTFQYYFYQKGLFATSFFTIWIHGTIEISAIIIAGAAGFVLGRGLLFPETYTRGIAMQVSAKRAVRIIVGIVPLFILAGFLESYVTRLTDLPLVVKMIIIVLSLALIVGGYVLYPISIYRRYGDTFDYDVRPQIPLSAVDTADRKMTYGEVLTAALSMYRLQGSAYIGYVFKWMLPVFAAGFAVWLLYFANLDTSYYYHYMLFGVDLLGVPMYGVYTLAICSCIVLACQLFIEEEDFSTALFFVYLRQHLIPTILIVGPTLGALYFLPYWSCLIVAIFLPPHYAIVRIYAAESDGIGSTYSRSMSLWLSALLHIVVMAALSLLIFLGVNSGVGSLLRDFLMWHDVFSVPHGSYLFFTSLIYVFFLLALIPIFVNTVLFSYKSDTAKQYATDMKKQYESFGKGTTIFEGT